MMESTVQISATACSDLQAAATPCHCQSLAIIRYILGSWAVVRGVPADTLSHLLGYVGFQFELQSRWGWRWHHESCTFAVPEENGDVLIPSGLVQRVTGYLSENGWRVQVYDERQDRRPLRKAEEVRADASPDMASFLGAIDDYRMGQIPVRGDVDVVRHVTQAAAYFPDARILVVTANRSRAYRMRNRFVQHGWTEVEVRRAGTATEYRQVVIAAASSGLAGDIGRYDFVFYADCGVLDGKRAIKAALRDNSVRVFGFAMPGQELSARASLAVEAVCGPLLYEKAPEFDDRGSVPAILKDCPMQGGYERQKRRLADLNDRISADAHEGTPDDFLRRHTREARQAARSCKERRFEFALSLLNRVADSRNLYIAIESLRNNSQKRLPGPDGFRLDELTFAECWNLAHTLGEAIRRGTYRPGPVWLTKIPKMSGKGTRTIEIGNEADRVVERGILQILQPLVDPNFDPNSFGFRPGLGREHALAALDRLTEQGSIWTTEDLKNAFDNIPHPRLWDVLRSHGLNPSLIYLIDRIVCRDGRKRGIAQGSPLSPLLLNLYCDHFIDKPWRRRNPGAPLLRYADDLMIISPDPITAQADRRLLQQLTQGAGLPLKEKDRNTIDAESLSVHQGQWTEWLGFRVRPDSQNRIEIRLGSQALDALQTHLEEQIPVPPGYSPISQIVRGWVDQQGPCFPYEKDVLRGYSRMVSVLSRVAPKEVPPTLEQFQGWWEQAYCRYEQIRRVLLLVKKRQRLTGGSAGGHSDSAEIGRSGGAPALGAPLLSTPHFLLYASGGCLRNPGPGGWAYVVDGSDEFGRFWRGESRSRLTGPRAELMAVIRGLERLRSPSWVTIVTESEYVARGITEWLPRWRQNHWRRGKGRKGPKNCEPWRRLDAGLEFHQVDVEWLDCRKSPTDSTAHISHLDDLSPQETSE